MSSVNSHCPASVLVVDSHPIVRAGFIRLLEDQTDLSICGEASGLSDALKLFRQCTADVVTADVSLEDGSGLDLTRELLAINPDTRILICSDYEDTLYAERALRAGARGYINKHESPERILTAIRRVRDRSIYLSEQMTERMICRTIGNHEDIEQSPIDSLSDRELEVFEQIGHGATTRQIALKLHLSPKTIETYRENIKSKLNLHNATELTQHAVRWVLEREAGTPMEASLKLVQG